MLYVPRHLPNKLEYKVLCCISVHYQSRMASNGIAITPSHPPTVQAGQNMGVGGWVGGFSQSVCPSLTTLRSLIALSPSS
jgi:hypothetical protein